MPSVFTWRSGYGGGGGGGGGIGGDGANGTRECCQLDIPKDVYMPAAHVI